jgi:hypothetical protein
MCAGWSGVGCCADTSHTRASAKTHIESESFADTRVMQPKNEMQACSSTTLPMSFTCICQRGASAWLLLLS